MLRIQNDNKKSAEACVRRAVVGRLGTGKALGVGAMGWGWGARLLRRFVRSRSSRSHRILVWHVRLGLRQTVQRSSCANGG